MVVKKIPTHQMQIRHCVGKVRNSRATEGLFLQETLSKLSYFLGCCQQFFLFQCFILIILDFWKCFPTLQQASPVTLLSWIPELKSDSECRTLFLQKLSGAEQSLWSDTEPSVAKDLPSKTTQCSGPSVQGPLPSTSSLRSQQEAAYIHSFQNAKHRLRIGTQVLG